MFFLLVENTKFFFKKKLSQGTTNRNWGIFTLVQPQVLLRNWDEEILDSFHVLMLKLSFTKYMAKYLDSSICSGCALSPQDLIFTKTGPFRSLPLDQMDALQPIIPLPPTVQMAKLLQPI